MLKRYTSSDTVRWVGKAWEIRQAIRRETKNRGANAFLADLLVSPDKETHAPLVKAVRRPAAPARFPGPSAGDCLPSARS